jgi:hypothetical protein
VTRLARFSRVVKFGERVGYVGGQRRVPRR